jgi:hypothetical protein
MSENEILVDQTENVENTTEEIPVPKMYSQEEVDAIVGKAKARTKAKIEKQYEREYGELRDVLKAGMGKDSVGEITSDLREFYGNKKGIQMPRKIDYSAKDIEVLARAEADEIINSGFDEVVEEVDRLASIGPANMTARDKVMFKVLADFRQSTERNRELAKLGVTEDVYNSKEFKEFASNYKDSVPITTVYNHYAKTLPKKEIKTMGSMKNSESSDSGVKEFYTVEEVKRIPVSEYYKNPALWEAVNRSRLKWK